MEVYRWSIFNHTSSQLIPSELQMGRKVIKAFMVTISLSKSAHTSHNRRQWMSLHAHLRCERVTMIMFPSIASSTSV